MAKTKGKQSDPLGLSELQTEELRNLQELWAERLLLISTEIARRGGGAVDGEAAAVEALTGVA